MKLRNIKEREKMLKIRRGKRANCHTHIHTRACTCTHRHTCTCTRTHVRPHRRVRTQTRRRAHTDTGTHTHTPCTHMHAQTCARTHTGTNEAESPASPSAATCCKHPRGHAPKLSPRDHVPNKLTPRCGPGEGCARDTHKDGRWPLFVLLKS